MNLLKNYNLSKLTTIRIGGKAKFFAQPADFNELRELILFSREKDIPIYVLGGGSNTIFGDIGGLVISLRKLTGMKVERKGEVFLIESLAGTPLREIVSLSVKENLDGLYRLVGFPATLGGAIAMNAGAFGVEISSFVRRVIFVDWNGEIKEKNSEEIEFSYRSSPFPREGLVLSCLLELPRSDTPVEGEFKRIREKRKRTQPIDKPTSGSTFKNPYPLYAGELLERVGMKSYRIGDVSFSEKHSNFLINHGEGRYGDVLKLVNEAKRRVYEEFGVRLEEEVRFIEDSGVDGWKVL
ncbi:UDP-N-acetylmuramate dehydrogenase [Hydrogenivirga caldilitoris]|uniref:UDP-N-acetylenolpyruvoylglucosamine reductase n=1 Tax=Hydrogenivirga caldilitoris TaxID=246264 RepID=A0A497XT91_9AQUI|nr:UDP-N-acetylmuramate dehydrogenase [Hydrogenivirga caldilitoris]RLJ70352.1 UDP-N-acetylmuramate dehydrogenase [Hydrogenivirga caldilitoris]